MEYQKSPCKECGNNLEYPSSIAGTTITCPHCGQWTELVASPEPVKSHKSVIAFIICGVVLLGLAVAVWLRFSQLQTETSAAAKSTSATVVAPASNSQITVVAIQPAEQMPGKPRPKAPADLRQLGDVSLEKTKGNSLVYAVGTVTNDSGWQRFSVKIDLDLINLKGRIIGKTQDQKAIIEPHQSWQFRALIPNPDAVAAKASSLTEEK